MNWKDPSTYIQTVFVPIVTVGTALMVAFLNYSVSKVDQDLKKRITSFDIAIKQSQDERAKLEAEREFNFKIYDLVQKSLEEESQAKQEVAKQFILVMVHGELRSGLLGVLNAGGTPEIQRDTGLVIEVDELISNLEGPTKQAARTRLIELYQDNRALVSRQFAYAIKEKFQNYLTTLGIIYVLSKVEGGWEQIGDLLKEFRRLAESPNMKDETFKRNYRLAQNNARKEQA